MPRCRDCPHANVDCVLYTLAAALVRLTLCAACHGPMRRSPIRCPLLLPPSRSACPCLKLQHMECTAVVLKLHAKRQCIWRTLSPCSCTVRSELHRLLPAMASSASIMHRMDRSFRARLPVCLNANLPNLEIAYPSTRSAGSLRPFRRRPCSSSL